MDDVELVIGVVGAAVGVTGLLFGVLRELYSRRTARPVLICHERENRSFTPGEGWRAVVEVENASDKYAFNIRFGVELNNVPFPWAHDPLEDEGGSRRNFLAPGELTGHLYVSIPSEFNYAGGKNTDEGRVYWCQYEAVNRTRWETRNPWLRTSQFTIKRLRWQRLRRWLGSRKRTRTLAKGERRLRETTAEARRQIEESADYTSRGT